MKHAEHRHDGDPAGSRRRRNGQPRQSPITPHRGPRWPETDARALASVAETDPPAGVRVLIVDRRPIVRSALASLLETAPDLCVVGVVANCAECCARLSELEPDIVLCDLSLNESCAAQELDGWRRVVGIAPALVMSDGQSERQVAALAQAGFRGMLTSGASSETLFAAIRVVAKGGCFLASPAENMVMSAIGWHRQGGDRSGAELTDKEFAVLRLIAQGRTNQEIADEIYISKSSVKQHVASIFAKLGVSRRAAAVRVATAEGLLPG